MVGSLLVETFGITLEIAWTFLVLNHARQTLMCGCGAQQNLMEQLFMNMFYSIATIRLLSVKEGSIYFEMR